MEFHALSMHRIACKHEVQCENYYFQLETINRRDDMSRLASSRNVQWSAEGATIYVYPRTQNQLKLPSPRSGTIDEIILNYSSSFFGNPGFPPIQKQVNHTLPSYAAIILTV